MLNRLMKMQASFSGGVVGTVSQFATGASETGYGRFAASINFNKPTDPSSNYWQLEAFKSDSFNLPEKLTIPVQHGDEFGRYVGNNDGAVVDGGVHGTIDNLQTAGTFAVNGNNGNNYAITGSYAGRGEAR